MKNSQNWTDLSKISQSFAFFTMTSPNSIKTHRSTTFEKSFKRILGQKSRKIRTKTTKFLSKFPRYFYKGLVRFRPSKVNNFSVSKKHLFINKKYFHMHQACKKCPPDPPLALTLFHEGQDNFVLHLYSHNLSNITQKRYQICARNIFSKFFSTKPKLSASQVASL